MLDELKKRAEQAVELAKAAGAQDAWARASRNRSVEFIYRDGKFEKVQESTSRGITIKIYTEGRYSAHSTTDLRTEQLQSFIAEAVALTRALQPDPFRQITDPALFDGREEVDLDLFDPKMAGITKEQREAWCVAMNEHASADSAVISASATTTDEHEITATASSNGFSGVRESTSVWNISETTIRGEGDKRPEAYQYEGARHLSDLTDPAKIGDQALEFAKRRLGQAKGPTGKMNLVVDPRSAGRIISAFIGPADAQSIQQGQSFWADKIGKKIASDVFTLTDDPFIPRGFGSRLFDGEGISAKKMPVIEAGVVKNVYVDTYYGKKAEMAVTTGSPSNLVIALGAKNLAEILKEAKTGIYLTSWLGGNSDPTTGDFSFGLSGHIIENGEIGAPVGEMNVTGNLISLFEHLVMVGNDPWRYSTLLAPTLMFSDVVISGV